MVVKPFIFFNVLAFLCAFALGASVPQFAGAVPGEDMSRPRAGDEPVLKVEAPAGHCALEAADLVKPNHTTGYRPGLASGMELLAFYVPCASLAEVRAGKAEWLPEWYAVEKNTVTYPSDDERHARHNREAIAPIKLLCQDAQSAQWGHVRHDGKEFAARVEDAVRQLSAARPEIFVGVVAEQDHACYLATVRLLVSPSGRDVRVVDIAAFTEVANRWIVLGARRQVSPTRDDMNDLLTTSQRAAQDFVDQNR